MHFLTRSLPRRTVLKGMGATLALPFLEAMLPASTSARRRQACPAISGVLHAERNGDGILVAQDGRCKLRDDADPRATRARIAIR